MNNQRFDEITDEEFQEMIASCDNPSQYRELIDRCLFDTEILRRATRELNNCYLLVIEGVFDNGI